MGVRGGEGGWRDEDEGEREMEEWTYRWMRKGRLENEAAWMLEMKLLPRNLHIYLYSCVPSHMRRTLTYSAGIAGQRNLPWKSPPAD